MGIRLLHGISRLLDRFRLTMPHPGEVCMVMLGVVASCYFFYPGCIVGDSEFSWGEALL